MKSINEIMQYYTPKQFYLMGMIVFAIVFVCNIISLNHYWVIKILSDKVSSVAMVGFYIGIWLLFYKMYLDLRATEKLIKPTSEEELDDIIKETSIIDR